MLPLAERLGREDSGFERVEDRRTVASVLPVLTPREREVITLRFFGGLSQTEIAERIGVSQMQVSRVLRAALTRLSIVAEYRCRDRAA
jgi:RNA polymerase sigma-B factor